MKKKTLAALFCLTLAAAVPAADISATGLVGVFDGYGEASDAQETVEEAQASEQGQTKKKKKKKYFFSYLTGEPMEKNQRASRPMAVMIDNVEAATPQSGIGSAGVIYEIPAQYDINRLLAIFDNYEDISRIGPVRSCRDYFIDFAVEYDAFYTHFGQVVYAFDILNSDVVDNISGLQYQEAAGELTGYAGEDIFWRADERPAPHNVYTDYAHLQTAIERNDYRKKLKSSYDGHFQFAPEGERVSYSEGTAAYIEPDDYDNHPSFTYDEASGLYLRSQRGAAHIDDLTGEQLSFTNVIVQFCPFDKFDENGYWNVDTNAGGEAVVFTNGTYQTVTWKKDVEWGQTRYYDASGNEITLNRGKTWICIVQDSKRDGLLIQ